MIRCTVGVLAHEEERDLVPALRSLLAQEMSGICSIDEVVVVASGGDRTLALADILARSDPRVHVEAQPDRTGKAAAVNRLIARARGEVIVLAGADLLVEPTAVERLVEPFADPGVGMTGAQVIPLDDRGTWLGRLNELEWRLHHALALVRPKLGELVAFRNVVPGLPADTATDEAALEALLRARGFGLRYVPAARVYNSGARRWSDFLARRRRIAVGHRRLARRLGHRVASLGLGPLTAVGPVARSASPTALLDLFALAVTEAVARSLAVADDRAGRDHRRWRPIRSARGLQAPDRPLRLLVAPSDPPPGASRRLRQRLAALPGAAGRLLWCEPGGGIVIALSDGPGALDAALGALTENLRAVAGRVGGPACWHVATFPAPAAMLADGREGIGSLASRPRG